MIAAGQRFGHSIAVARRGGVVLLEEHRWVNRILIKFFNYCIFVDIVFIIIIFFSPITTIISIIILIVV